MEDKAFSLIDWVGQCLVDKKRTNAFKAVINRLVKPGSIVYDMGTGSGIMALFAAKAKAKKVYAIEYDPFIAKIAKENILRNKLENKIKVIIGDTRKLSFRKIKKPDIVIAEMLTTGMIDEYQIQTINNLHKKKIATSLTKFIPWKQETYASLAYANFSMFGFKMNMVLHLWKTSKMAPKPRLLTKFEMLNSINFSRTNNEIFEKVIIFRALRSGKANCLYLKSKTFLDKKFFLLNTESVNAPVIIPIPEIELGKNENLKLKIKYRFGGGYEKFSVENLS